MSDLLQVRLDPVMLEVYQILGLREITALCQQLSL